MNWLAVSHLSGAKVSVSVGKVSQPESSVKFSTESMADIKKVCGIRGTGGVKKLGTMLNKTSGAGVVRETWREARKKEHSSCVPLHCLQ